MQTSTRLIGYLLTPNTHPALLEQLRVLYIEALAALSTHPIPKNTPEEQQQWWQGLDHTKERVWLMSLRETPWDIIGFVKLRKRDGYYSPMFALAKRVHGQGLGAEMIQFYLSQVPVGTPLRGEQLVSNEAICHLNQKAGWIVLSRLRVGGELVETVYHPHNVHVYDGLPEGTVLWVDTAYPQRAYDEIVRHHGYGSNT